MWKLITSLLSNEITRHLNQNQVWPWEQKGCRRKSRGTEDHLLVDKLVMSILKTEIISMLLSVNQHFIAYHVLTSLSHTYKLRKCQLWFVLDLVPL